MRQEISALYWQLAVTRKLEATARAERRFADINYYAKFALALELRANKLLKHVRGEK